MDVGCHARHDSRHGSRLYNVLPMSLPEARDHLWAIFLMVKNSAWLGFDSLDFPAVGGGVGGSSSFASLMALLQGDQAARWRTYDNSPATAFNPSHPTRCASRSARQPDDSSAATIQSPHRRSPSERTNRPPS